MDHGGVSSVRTTCFRRRGAPGSETVSKDPRKAAQKKEHLHLTSRGSQIEELGRRWEQESGNRKQV